MLSTRLPADTARAVALFAEQHDTTRSDAIRQLVELGLASANGQSDRRRQERALDDALANTFPASDPVEAEEPALNHSRRGRGRRRR